MEKTAERSFRETILVVALYAALVLFVVASQTEIARPAGTGAIASPGDLIVELHSTGDEPTSWTQGLEVPWRYRWVFRAIVLATTRLSPSLRTADGFYATFIFWSFATLLFACVAFDRYLRDLEFTSKQTIAGVALFLTGFPVLFAWDMPIHTKEDFLAVGLVCLALSATLRDRPIATVVLIAIAVNVREMCLLGAIPFWFVSKKSARVRATVLAVAFLATLLVTSIRELEPRLPWFLARKTSELKGHATQLRAPIEAELYIFLAFGASWIAALLGARVRRARVGLEAWRHDMLGSPVVPIAIVLSLAVSVLLGQAREARTIYFASPWVLPLALEYLIARGKSDARRREVRVAFGIAFALGLVFLAQVARDFAFVDALRGPREDPNTTERATSFGLGWSFQPGFQAPVEVEIDGRPQLVLPYTASPWNGVWFIVHASLTVALIAGAAVSSRTDTDGGP